MNVNEYLDAIKAKHGLKSDYQLAKKMNWSSQRTSSYRNGKTLFDDDACLEVASALGVNSLEVVADINAERAKTDAVRQFWQHVAKMARVGLAAGVVFFMGSMTYTPPAQAETPKDVYYVKCESGNGLSVEPIIPLRANYR